MPIIRYKIATLPSEAQRAERLPRKQRGHSARLGSRQGEYIGGIAEAGRLLGLSADRIKNLISTGRLQCLRIGRRYYFHRDWLNGLARAVPCGQGKAR